MEMQRIINFETTSDFVGGFVVPASKQLLERYAA